MKISASDQVAVWLCELPRQTKHRVRQALRGLAEGKGDIKGLQGPLEGFNRLRIGDCGSLTVRFLEMKSVSYTPTHGTQSMNFTNRFLRIAPNSFLVAGGIILGQNGDWQSNPLPKPGLVGDDRFIPSKAAGF